MTTMTANADDRSAAGEYRAAGRARPQPARICHVSMHLKTGGLERLLVEFARRHDGTQFEPLFVALQDTGRPGEDIIECGRPVHRIDMASRGKLKSLRRLRELLKSEQIDLVHTHNTYAHFYGAIAALTAGVRAVVNTQHGRGCGPGWKSRLQFRIANRLTSRVVGVSVDASTLCSEDDRWSRGKISTIWNGIDVHRFEYRGPQVDPALIAVGRLSPEKDLPTLLRAVELAARSVPDLRVTIVGDGPERAGLETLARELSVADRVKFLGERPDIPALLAQAGCYVASSRTEGVSLTLLEAMAVGLPAITTRIGGNAEVVVDGATGRLVPAGDPARLADAIVTMCSERDLWPAMGRLARERVEAHFSVERMVREYERLYANVLAARTRRSGGGR
jgi:glycosyltransferase involved in cell wall biosynthesis